MPQKNTEKTGVRLFALRGTGKLISVVCWDESGIIQGGYINKEIRASWGYVVTERSLRGQARSYKFDEQHKSSSEDALSVLKNESKRLKRANINSDIVLKKPALENVGSVFLYLKAIVQRGNVSEVLVFDGIWASNDDLVSYIREADLGVFAEGIREGRKHSGKFAEEAGEVSHRQEQRT